ncbi:MAG: hypothetical protein ABJP70_01425 [Erythrobacter sp.]
MIPMLPDIPQPASSDLTAGSLVKNPANEAQMLQLNSLQSSPIDPRDPTHFKQLLDGFARGDGASTRQLSEARAPKVVAVQAQMGTALLEGGAERVAADVPSVGVEHRLPLQTGFAADPGALLPVGGKAVQPMPLTANVASELVDADHEAAEFSETVNPDMGEPVTQPPASARTMLDPIEPIHPASREILPSAPQGSIIAMASVLSGDQAHIPPSQPATTRQSIADAQGDIATRADRIVTRADREQFELSNRPANPTTTNPPTRSDRHSQDTLRAETVTAKQKIGPVPDFPVERLPDSDADLALPTDLYPATRDAVQTAPVVLHGGSGEFAKSVVQSIVSRDGSLSTRSVVPETPAIATNTAIVQNFGKASSEQGTVPKQPATLPASHQAEKPLSKPSSLEIPDTAQLDPATHAVPIEGRVETKLRQAPQPVAHQLPVSPVVINAQLRPAQSRDGQMQVHSAPALPTQQVVHVPQPVSTEATTQELVAKAMAETEATVPPRGEGERASETQQLFQATSKSTLSQFTAASSAVATNPQPTPAQPVPNSAVISEARPVDDIGATIDRLIESRETARAQRPELTVRHSEFGAVHMRLEAAGGDLRATLANRDPGFVPAVQAALAERAVAPTSEAAMTGQRSPDQQNGTNNGSQNPSNTGAQSDFEQRYGSSTGSDQGSSKPYLEQNSVEEDDSAQSGLIAEDQNPQNDQSAGGLFA